MRGIMRRPPPEQPTKIQRASASLSSLASYLTRLPIGPGRAEVRLTRHPTAGTEICTPHATPPSAPVGFASQESRGNFDGRRRTAVLPPGVEKPILPEPPVQARHRLRFVMTPPPPLLQAHPEVLLEAGTEGPPVSPAV